MCRVQELRYDPARHSANLRARHLGGSSATRRRSDSNVLLPECFSPSKRVATSCPLDDAYRCAHLVEASLD
jgi:hypothetical protein